MKINKAGEMEYLTFSALEETGCVEHLFSTRAGGVSKGMFATMNLSDARGDEPQAVLENYRRIANVLHNKTEAMVLSKQTHTTNVRAVYREDAGNGVTKQNQYEDVDGLVTNEPGLILVTLYADCVPLYMVDPVHKAIGLSHSGWRGTVGKIGARTVEKMSELYDTRPEDVIAAIGPSICQDCYEVSEDVIDAFKESFQETVWQTLFRTSKEKSKYQLNLWEANRQVLLEAGIRADHINMANLCTCCHSDYLFSHRATQGKRGNLGAFLMLRSKEAVFR
ncbi:MAG: peptidoglycan editing factor PgeF [Lachnospiraceae bacterium]